MRQDIFVTKSGLRIGSAYCKTPPAQSRDAELIQSALIDPPLPAWERALDAFNRNAFPAMLAFAVAAAALGLAFK